MIAILINCITLGSYQPCYDTRCESNRCQWLKTFDHVIFLFFFMEMLIKMVAMGVSNAPQAYLADYWNRLDCFIVIAGGLEYILDIGNVNLTAIRTVRVLRPLRAINRIPSMRILVTLLLDTLPMLGNVLLLCFFVFFIFGIIGVQLWSGLLRQRCFISLPANMTKPSYVPSYYRLPNSDKEYLCSTLKDSGLHRCQDLPPLRSTDLSAICQNTLPPDWQPPKLAVVDVPRFGNDSWREAHRHEDRFIDGELVPLDLVPGDESSPFLVKQMSPLIAQSVFQPAYAPRQMDSLPSLRQKRAATATAAEAENLPRIGAVQSSTWSPPAVATPSSSEASSSAPTTAVAAGAARSLPARAAQYATADNSIGLRGAALARQGRTSGDHYTGADNLHNKSRYYHHHRQHHHHRRNGELGAKIRMTRRATTDNSNNPLGPRLGPKSSSFVAGGGYNGGSGGGGGGGVDPMVETNANSDQFDSISQSEIAKGDKSSGARRRNFLRKKANKASCINWNKYYTDCRAGDTNPFQGTISFDNVGMAWTTIFLVISLEGWSDIMYLLQDSHSFWVWIYFVLLIVIGSFFMINLCLVVIATQFSATKKREMERMRQERLKFSSSSTLTAASESTNCYTVIVKSIARCLRRAKISFINSLKRRKCSRLHKKRLRDRQQHSESRQVTGLHSENHDHPSSLGKERLGSSGGGGRSRSTTRGRARLNNDEPAGACASLKNVPPTGTSTTETAATDAANQVSAAATRRDSWRRSSRMAHWHNNDRETNENSAQLSGEPLIGRQKASSLKETTRSRLAGDQESEGAGHQAHLKRAASNNKRLIKLGHADCGPSCRMANSRVAASGKRSVGGRSSSKALHSSCRHYHECEIENIDITFCPKFISNNHNLQRFWLKSNENIKKLVDHRYFQRLILLAILINAISMGIEYHNQPAQLTEAVEISNIVFACLFLIEMMLKLIAHGLYDYVIDGFNCFDGCIVILSILELFESSSGSGLSVLRTFRLLRILKLVRFMPALRRQLVIMLRTLDNVAVFFALLVLFIFIFSILGMNVFGCKFCETLPDGSERCDRKNFNSLLWSLVTVFQILTQEDWNVVLFNGMEKTSHWAALYFVLLMTFGNYVLFNLLVAILVEGFSQEDDFKVSSSSSYTINNIKSSRAQQPARFDDCGSGGGGGAGSPYPPLVLDPMIPSRQSNQTSIASHTGQVRGSTFGDYRTGAIPTCFNEKRIAASTTKAALGYGETRAEDYCKKRSFLGRGDDDSCSRLSQTSPSASQLDEHRGRADEMSGGDLVSDAAIFIGGDGRQSSGRLAAPGKYDNSVTARAIERKSWHKSSGNQSAGGHSQLGEGNKNKSSTTKGQQEFATVANNGSGSSLTKTSSLNLGPQPDESAGGAAAATKTIASRRSRGAQRHTDGSNIISSSGEKHDDDADYDDDDLPDDGSQYTLPSGSAASSSLSTSSYKWNGAGHASDVSGSSGSHSSAKTISFPGPPAGNFTNAPSQSIQQRAMPPPGVDNKQAVNEDLSQIVDGGSAVKCDVGRGLNAPAVSQQRLELCREQERDLSSAGASPPPPPLSMCSSNNNGGDKFVNLASTQTTAADGSGSSPSSALSRSVGKVAAADDDDDESEDVESARTAAVAEIRARCAKQGGSAGKFGGGAKNHHCYIRCGESTNEECSSHRGVCADCDSGEMPLDATGRSNWPPTSQPSRHHHHQQPGEPTGGAITYSSHVQVDCMPLTEVSRGQHHAGQRGSAVQQQQQPQQRQQPNYPPKYWNYGQLVTSIMDQSRYNTLAAPAAAAAAAITNSSPSLAPFALFGVRRPPKRLVYFYDINDDIDEEIEFLTSSLETKSYATSMMGQHDHYLDNIAKSQAAAAKIKANNKLQAQYRISMYRAEHDHHIRALALDSLDAFGSGDGSSSSIRKHSGSAGRRADSLEGGHYAQPPPANAAAAAASTMEHGHSLAGHKRSSQGAVAHKTRGSSGRLLRDPQTVELLLSPHWCSFPSHLNSKSIAMMRFYQSSCTSNFYFGKRERAILGEHGKFDKSCCRVDYDAYTKALNVFIPQNGLPFDAAGNVKFSSTKHNYQLREEQHQQQRQHSTTTAATTTARDSVVGPDNDVNLGVIYEPFRLFPNIAGSAINPSSRVSATEVPTSPPPGLDPATVGAPVVGANSWQRGFLKSLENYASAVARYEERQAALARRRAQESSMMMNSSSNLNRTTQALRRGSVVVLSKLKILHAQNNGDSCSPNTIKVAGDNQQQQQQHQANAICKSVPRLSLTKAESLANNSSDNNASSQEERTNEGGNSSSVRGSGVRLAGSRGGGIDCSDVAIPIASSNESLASPILSQDLSTGSAGRLQTIDGFDSYHDSHHLHHHPQMSRLHHPPQGLSGHVRHSIANLPMRSLLETTAEIETDNNDDPLMRPASYTPNLASKRSLPRPSLIGWFNRSQAHDNSTTTNRNSSCFSQTSKATSVLSEKCTKLLRPNLRRRRSFSGPFEWLQHEHRPPYDMMLTPKKPATKKRLKRMKPQKSNSSDYHSLNNRRVYKLDSRGFQTKLKGVFYVITHDPLTLNANPTTMQARDLRDVTSSNYDLGPPTQVGGGQLVENNKDNISSNEIESSFFNTSAEDNSTGDRSQSRDTNGRSTLSRGQHRRTFLVHFHWTQWMIQRRHYSLFIFSPQSRIRRFCFAVISRKEFDYFVLFFISMNCVTLAMERPKIPPWSKEREFLTIANYYFTFMFTLEMALKVIAKGLYYGKDAYLSDSWNIMDGALVGFSLFDLLLSVVADRSPRIFAILRVFRLLRSLRPLRVINRLMGLKLVVQTLLLSLRPIGNIVLICCTFFIIFGILGVQLFKGTFYYCDGPDPLEIMRVVRTREDCLMDPRNRWVNRKYNFDNLGQALMALFVLSSKDGWVNIMYTGLDAVGVDMQPRENYNEWRLLYFISFLLLVAFFVLNMFVGVVVENFHRCRKEQELEEKARRAEKRQRKLDKRRRKLREPPYYSNYGKCRLLLHKWVTGGYFDLLIAAVIGFNVVFMSLEHYQMPGELIHLLKVSNYVFTAAFILEAAIKSTALGMKRYLKDRWNQLDVMIVAMSIIGIIFEEMDSFTLPINPTLLRVLRVMRIARVLKLLKMAKGIRALLDTVMQALPQVGNLGLLFFLLFFIFAALGVELFGRLECNDEYPCSGLMDQHAHFQNFGLAFLTLFRVATGDNWNGIMKDTLRDKCDPSSNCLKNCCVSQVIAPLYFVVFVLLAQFVLVNVVVAVLMKHLEESHHEMEIDEEYELDKQLAEELEAKKRALLEARERQNLYWI